jgi:hypothetical protein
MPKCPSAQVAPFQRAINPILPTLDRRRVLNQTAVFCPPSPARFRERDTASAQFLF